jgi:hypothetical protein
MEHFCGFQSEKNWKKKTKMEHFCDFQSEKNWKLKK